MRKIINDPYLIGIKNKGEQYNFYRQLWTAASNKKIVTDFPIQIDTDTIDACNYDCIICHERGRIRSGKTINPEIVKRIINEGTGKGLYSINIGSVGEPYLKKEILFKLTEYAAAKGLLDIFVHTNFSLPTETDIIKTVEAGITCLCISMDACTSETYKKIRRGNFEKVLKNIQFLSEYKKSIGADYPIIRISAVPCYENKDELSRFMNFWTPYADIIEVQAYRHDTTHETEKLICKKTVNQSCSSPWQRLMLWPHGDVSICCAKEGLEKDIVLGNIESENKPLSAYWNSGRILEIRTAMENGNFHYLPTCRSCLTRTYLYD